MRTIPTLLATVILAPAFAAETMADKSDYTLFNPTPKAQMRELSTDRPDTTESPYECRCRALPGRDRGPELRQEKRGRG